MKLANATAPLPQEPVQQAKVIDIATVKNITPALSVREEEIMGLLAQGCQNKDVAARLYISVETVKVHVRNIYHKLGAGNRIEALNKWKGWA
jgi:DNA-binding NarL/FixJ family response regulator